MRVSYLIHIHVYVIELVLPPVVLQVIDPVDPFALQLSAVLFGLENAQLGVHITATPELGTQVQLRAAAVLVIVTAGEIVQTPIAVIVVPFVQNLTVPLTQSFVVGLLVPIHTFPPEENLTTSVLFVFTTKSWRSVVPIKLVVGFVPASP